MAASGQSNAVRVRVVSRALGILGAMRRTHLLVIAVVVMTVSAGFAPDAVAATRGGAGDQPDGWIKLCGLSLGCTIDPLPHPWKGRNVHNATGRRQTVFHEIDEGEGIRFWITIENDGSQADTYDVDGCVGNRTYEINRVLLGKHKRQDPGATDLTRRYKAGTLTFSLDAGERTVFTLNIITHDNKGVRYSCRTVFTSENDPSREDVVVAKMRTF
jgi:hypothetical protein